MLLTEIGQKRFIRLGILRNDDHWRVKLNTELDPRRVMYLFDNLGRVTSSFLNGFSGFFSCSLRSFLEWRQPRLKSMGIITQGHY